MRGEWDISVPRPPPDPLGNRLTQLDEGCLGLVSWLIS